MAETKKLTEAQWERPRVPTPAPTETLRCPAKDCLCDGLLELPISTEPEGIRRDRLCLYCRRQYRSHKSGLVEIKGRTSAHQRHEAEATHLGSSREPTRTDVNGDPINWKRQ